MLNKNEIIEVIQKSIQEVAPDVDALSLDPEGDFRDDLDLDSMDFMNLIIAVSKKTSIKIPESDYNQLQTLNGMLGYISARAA